MCWCCGMTLCTVPLSDTSQRCFDGIRLHHVLSGENDSFISDPFQPTLWILRNEIWQNVTDFLLWRCNSALSSHWSEERRKRSKLHWDRVTVGWLWYTSFQQSNSEVLTSCVMMGKDCPLLVGFNYVFSPHIGEEHGWCSFERIFCVFGSMSDVVLVYL